jgi:hypothetical protein
VRPRSREPYHADTVYLAVDLGNTTGNLGAVERHLDLAAFGQIVEDPGEPVSVGAYRAKARVGVASSRPDVENPTPGSDLPTKAAPSRGPKAIRREP